MYLNEGNALERGAGWEIIFYSLSASNSETECDHNDNDNHHREIQITNLKLIII